MLGFHRVAVVSAAVIFAASILVCDPIAVNAQGKLTYPELNTALKTKLPNSVFSNKTELVTWLITQIQRRKVDKPLTADREDDLRQAGATDELIDVIRTNAPLPPTPVGPVDLGDLIKHAVNLVKPEYTPEALAAGTTGEVKLSLELDEQGHVTTVSRLTMLPHGLTERAIAAARQSTFKPAVRDGKPSRATGLLTYNFKINLNIAATLAAADDLRGKRDCVRAVAEYARVISVDARNARALFGRGSCYMMAADYDRALLDIESAAKIDPDDPEIEFRLGVARDFKGDHASGAIAYGRALKIQPAYDKQPAFLCLYIDRPGVTPDQVRSEANTIINNCNQALRTADTSLASLLYFKRGVANRLKGDYEKAIADFENVRRTNPILRSVNAQFVVLYNNRGLEAFNKKDFKKAFDDITLAIQADPQSPTPYINRCLIYLYGYKKYDDAINDCSEAIRLSTKSSMAFNHRGYAYEQKKNLKEAAADYQTALQMDPQNTVARDNLARIRPKVPSLKNQ